MTPFVRYSGLWRIIVLAIPLLVVVGMTVFLHFDSPFGDQQRLIATCPFFKYTGWRCAGCGTLRALYCLSHGEVLMGLQFNPLIALALPAIVVMAFWSRAANNRWVAWATLIVVCVYTVMRNLMPALEQPSMEEARKCFAGETRNILYDADSCSCSGRR